MSTSYHQRYTSQCRWVLATIKDLPQNIDENLVKVATIKDLPPNIVLVLTSNFLLYQSNHNMAVVCLEMEGEGEVARRNFYHSLDHSNSEHYTPSRLIMKRMYSANNFILIVLYGNLLIRIDWGHVTLQVGTWSTWCLCWVLCTGWPPQKGAGLKMDSPWQRASFPETSKWSMQLVRCLSVCLSGNFLAKISQQLLIVDG